MSGDLIDPALARELTERIRVAVDNLWDLVVSAYQGRAWTALGYATWDAYVQKEFGSLRIRIPKEERREICNHLRDAGLSLRATATAIGYDKKIVQDALKSGGKVPTPPAAPPKPGRPANDRFWKTATDLCKMTDRMVRLAEEDAFTANREKIKEASLRDLVRARSALDEVINKLKGAL